MDFVLFEKLSELSGVELAMLIAAAAFFVVMLIVAVRYAKGRRADAQTPSASHSRTRALVYGALALALSFILSYIKLFSMPLGGSITLLSMLPLCMYACWYGPACGFCAALAYGLLQVLQGAYIMHPVQFVLDYFAAFACYGLAAFFPKKLPVGVLAAGLGRFICSVLSGVVFFSSYAADAGYDSALLYSLSYNGATIGVDAVTAAIVAALPLMRRLEARLRPASQAQ